MVQMKRRVQRLRRYSGEKDHISDRPRHIRVPHIGRQLLQLPCHFRLHSSIAQESPHILIPVADIVVIPSHFPNRLHEMQR
jgi:hypothetical protein